MRIRTARAFIGTRSPVVALAPLLAAASMLAAAPEARAQAADTPLPRVETPAAPAAAATAPAPRIIAVTRPGDLSTAPGPGDADEAAVAAGPPADAGSGETLTVFLDHAKVIRLPERTQTVIVGNPFIADVTVQRNGILVVTGKAYGATNLIALDAQGLLLAESMVSVQAPREDSVVVVQRGLERESYSCTPSCQPSLRLGDSEGHFGAVGAQATQRAGFATQAN